MKYPLLYAGVVKATSSVEDKLRKIGRTSPHRGKYLHLHERLLDALPLLEKGDLEALEERRLLRLVGWVNTLHFNPHNDYQQFPAFAKEMDALGFSYQRMDFTGDVFDSMPLNEKDYWPC